MIGISYLSAAAAVEAGSILNWEYVIQFFLSL